MVLCTRPKFRANSPRRRYPAWAALWYDLCTRNKKNSNYERPAYDKEALRENKGGMRSDSLPLIRSRLRKPRAPRSRRTTFPTTAPSPPHPQTELLPAADRTGRRGGQPLGRQHESRGWPRSRATRRRGITAHEQSVGRRRTQQNTAKRVCFQLPADGQVSEIAPRVLHTGGCRRDRDLQALSEHFVLFGVRGFLSVAAGIGAGGGSSSRCRCSGPAMVEAHRNRRG